MTRPTRSSARARSRIHPVVVGLVLALVALAWPRQASAYAWMIRHEYTTCNTCHADPSGGGLLTQYGRAQSEILLRSLYGKSPDEEPGRVKDFLWGVPLPDSVLLGGDVRSLYLASAAGTAKTTRLILMQADVQGQVTFAERIRVNGSLGYAHEGALPASVTHGVNDRLVSRLHWIGVDLGEDKTVLVRAGRMNLPFGIRSIEHTMWVRTESRTDINAAQQHGVSVAYGAGGIRAELMAIAGNFQLSPDAFRERGYSGYLEYALMPKAAVGVSSMVVHADRDVTRQEAIWRHAHGAFGRWSATPMLVLSAEIDALHSKTTTSAWGFAGMLQADAEVTRGLHLMGTLESKKLGGGDGVSLGAWATAAWFFAPHADLRVDGVFQNLALGGSSLFVKTFLGQVHVFL